MCGYVNTGVDILQLVMLCVAVALLLHVIRLRRKEIAMYRDVKRMLESELADQTSTSDNQGERVIVRVRLWERRRGKSFLM